MAAPLRIYSRPRGVKAVSRRGGAEDGKEYLGKLVRLIPSEVIGLYLAVSGPIPKEYPIVLVAVSVGCLIATFVVRAWQTADPANHKPPQWSAVAISCVAYLIWLYSSGGPFAAYNVYIPWLGTILVGFFVFFVPYIYQGDPFPPTGTEPAGSPAV